MPDDNSGDTIYGFSSMDDVVRVDRTVRAYERNGQPTLRYRSRYPIGNNRLAVGIYNDSGLSIPPFGVVLLKGSQAAKNGPEDFDGPLLGTVASVKQPDTYGCQVNAFVLDEAAIFGGVGGTGLPNQSFGTVQQVPPFIVAYDGADGVPAVNERWGPRAGTFLLKKNTGGFLVIGIYDDLNKFVRVVPEPMMSFRGQPVADVASGASGDVKVFFGGVNTGVVIPSVLNDSSCTVKGGKNCTCEYMLDVGGTNPWQFKIFRSQ